MTFIQPIEPDDAEGQLARIYDASVKRGGRVYNIIKVQSLNPPALQSMMQLYLAVMHGDSPLSRAQREMMAVVVSRANDCHY